MPLVANSLGGKYKHTQTHILQNSKANAILTKYRPAPGLKISYQKALKISCQVSCVRKHGHFQGKAGLI